MKSRRNLLIGSIIVAFSMTHAHALSFEWAGFDTGLATGVSNTWDTNLTANWWDGVGLIKWPALGGNDDDAVFGGTAGTVTITTATANDISFNTTGYTLSGGTLTLNGTTPTITNGSGINALISSVITGSAGLTKAGDGILTLAGTNTYNGITTISAGTVVVQNSAAFGANGNNITVNSGAALDLGGTMSVNGLNQGTRVFTIHGTGVGGTGVLTSTATNSQINAISKVVLGGNATIGGSQRWDLRGNTPTLNLAGFTLTKTGANYIALVGAAVTPGVGNIIINQGELNLTTSTNLGGSASNSVTINNGGTLGMYQSSSAHAWTLNLNAGSTLRGENGSSSQNVWAGAVSANGNFSLLSESGHNLTVQGNISGTGGLTKTGAGTAILSGNNSLWSGGITISGGSLQVSSANSFGTGTSITTAGGSSNAALVLGNGVTSGSGKSITIAGGGAGGFFGALSTTGTATWQGSVVIGAATGTRVGTLGNSGALTISGDISEPGGTPSELIIRTQNAADALQPVILTGNNSYTGGTRLSVGTLRLGSANAIGTGSGNLTLSGNTTLSSDSSTARIVSNNVVFEGNSILGHATFNGKLTFNGTVALGAAERTLTINSPVEFGNTISATGAFGIIKAGSADLTLSGGNDFAGSVTVSAGNLILSNANTFAGGVNINGGKLVVGHGNAMGPTPKTINVNAGGTLELAANSTTPTYSFNTGSGGTASFILNRATLGAALSQDFTTYTLGNSEALFQKGSNVTSGVPTVNIPSVVLTAGATGLGYAKLTANDVNLNIGTLNRTGTSAGVFRLGGSSTGNVITDVVSNGSGGSYTITKEDSGTWELAGVNTYTGVTTISNGKLILSGNRVATSSAIVVGNVAGQTGILDIRGDLPMGSADIGVGTSVASATGVVNHSAGLVSFTSGNALLIGRNVGNVSGTYNLSGGELRTFSSTSRGVMIGVNDGTAGNLINATFNLSGSGFLNNATGTLQVVRGDSTSSYHNSSYNQTNGTSTNATLLVGGNGTAGANSTASFSVTGGTFSATTFSNLSRGNNVSSTITIGGTADVTLPAFPATRGTGSTAMLIFDGGVLRPTASSTGYLGGLTSATINNGGAKFNTGAFDITVSQALLAGSGSGGLAKEGAGVLTLSGGNTYIGGTTITGGTIKVANATALGANSSTVSVSSGAVLDLNGITMTGTNALTLNGTGISSGGALTNSSSTAGTYAGLLTLGGTSSIIASGGNIILSNTGTITGSGFGFTVGGGFNTSIASIIGTGGGSLAKQDAGTLTLSGPNTYTGGTTLNGGVIVVSNASALGNASSAVQLNGGTLRILLDSTTPINTHAITVGGNATVQGGKASSNTAGITQTLGTLSIGANQLSISADSSIQNNTAYGISFGATTLTGSATFDVGNRGTGTGTLTLGAIASSSNGITKSGAGTLVLAGNNGYTGSTLINTGTLQVGNGGTTGSLSPSSSITNNGTLAFNRSNTMTQGTDFASVIEGNGGLTKSGSGTLILSGVNTFTGGVTVTAGTLRIANSNALGSGVKTLTSAGGSRVVELSGGVTLASNISLSMSSNSGDGLGLSSIDGDNTIQGSINYTTGNPALNVSSSGSSKLTIAGNVTYTVANNTRIMYLGGSSTAANAINGNIGQSGTDAVLRVWKQGTGRWQLGGTNTYTGDTQVNGGILEIANGSSLHAASAVSVNNSGSELIVNGTVGGTLLVNATTTLSGSGTISGASEIRGIHNPGNSPGIQTFGSDLSYKGGSSVVNWELGLNTDIQGDPTRTFDQILVGGNLDFTDLTSLNLSFNVGGSGVLWSNPFWDSDRTWTIYDVAGTTSNISNLTLNSVNWLDSGSNAFNTARVGSSFSLSLSGNDVVLSYAIPEPRAALLGGLGMLALLRRRRI